MGYSVYRDPENPERWAGYGVPAECDMPDCTEEIGRGLGYKCEEHGEYELRLNGEQIDYEDFDENPDAEEVWVENEGCGLYFCSEHEDEPAAHNKIVSGKPDSIEWLRHMLTDDSWADWRAENPSEVAAHQKRIDEAASPAPRRRLPPVIEVAVRGMTVDMYNGK